MKYLLIILHLLSFNSYADYSSHDQESFSFGWHFSGGNVFPNNASTLKSSSFVFEIGHKPRQGNGIALEFSSSLIVPHNQITDNYNVDNNLYRASSVGINASRNMNRLHLDLGLSIGSFEHIVERNYYYYDHVVGETESSLTYSSTNIINESGTTNLSIGIGFILINTKSFDLTLASRQTHTLLSKAIEIENSKVDHYHMSEFQMKLNFRTFPRIYTHRCISHCYHSSSIWSGSDRLILELAHTALKLFFR